MQQHNCKLLGTATLLRACPLRTRYVRFGHGKTYSAMFLGADRFDGFRCVCPALGEGRAAMSKHADSACPFCGSNADCKHLPLLVDATFRSAEGGLLMKAFNSRWRTLGAPDRERNEREAFDELISEVESLCDSFGGFEHDDAVGMSAVYKTFSRSSAEKATSALRRFDAR